MSNGDQGKFEVKMRTMLGALKEGHFPTSTRTARINCEEMTVTELIQRWEERIGVYDRVILVKRDLKDALAERKRAQDEDKVFHAATVVFLKSVFGVEGKELVAFGVEKPKQRRALDWREKAIAVAKGQATRVLRGTKGPRQREKITLEGRSTVTVWGPRGEVLSTDAVEPVPAPKGLIMAPR